MVLDITALQTAARGGDPKAEERLFSLLTDRFHHFTRRRIWNHDDAEEVVQEALAVIVREYKTTEFSRNFAAWAYKVLNNRIMQYIRTRKYEKQKSNRIAEEQARNPLQTPEPMLKVRLIDCLKKVRDANLGYARILNLRHHGFKTDEICTRLDMTANNFYVSLARARAKLHKCLEDGAVR